MATIEEVSAKMQRKVVRPCKSCGHTIWWLAHVRTRNLAPINPERVLGGNICTNLVEETYVIVTPDPTISRHVNHFVTCPDRERYRRGKPDDAN